MSKHLSQAQQSAACTVSHTLEAPYSRWLLRSHDLAGDDLPLTQEFLSQMIGVQRSSVSLVAGTPQKAGVIEYARGHIAILNVERPQECACECYETVRSNAERILGRDARAIAGLQQSATQQQQQIQPPSDDEKQ